MFGILGGAGGIALPFNPFKLIVFIGWFYLCMYSVQRSDNSSLISSKYRYLSNIIAIFAGPLLLFVLFVADTVKKVSEGELLSGDVFQYTLDRIIKKPKKRSVPSGHGPDIQLMDTSGRSFNEVYNKQTSAGARQDNEVLSWTEHVILAAIQDRASDILIDPKSDTSYSVRFRVDGFLRVHDVIDGQKCNAMINSLKAIAGMDIAEKRRPQDGAFMAKTTSGQVFFRMASSGVLGGEKLAIRVMDQSRGLLTLSQAGFVPEQVKMLTKIIQQPSGMILVCGPTGSGKTTSLYAMMQTINFAERNVITVEDPIEHVMPNISQIEINPKADVTFATSLRSILRQDPDVIVVGEIRDRETAEMAMQAAQTGHLVLATLHSSSNIAALVRLIDLGVKPLLIASALNVIVSQRLVRVLCEHCKGPAELNQSAIAYCQKNSLNRQQIFQANGCGQCGGTGYYGRTAVMDVMYMNDEIKTLLCNQKLSPGDLKQKGDKQFHNKLRRDGMSRVVSGITTLNEVKRITASIG